MAYSVKVKIPAGPLVIEESILVESEEDIIAMEAVADEQNFTIISFVPVVIRDASRAVALINKIRYDIGLVPEPTITNDFNLKKDEGWIEWDSGLNPLTPEVMHQRRYRDGQIGNWTTGRMAGNYHWQHEGGNADIVAYRLKP